MGQLVEIKLTMSTHTRLGRETIRGAVLIQPFFDDEARTMSEENMAQSPRSALTLPTSDCYWRLALPAGA